MSFHSNVGISASAFLELTLLYLPSSVVDFEGNLYTQSKKTCIGSSIAAKLSEICLLVSDEILSSWASLESEHCLVGRYVDDIFILAPKSSCLESLLSHIHHKCSEIAFTSEFPTNSSLWFLDITFHRESGLCWEYGRPDAKPVLSGKSCHSKSVKNGVIKSLLSATIKTLCKHAVGFSPFRQLERLQEAGYYH